MTTQTTPIPQIGDEFPALSLPGLDGQMISTSDFHGKSLLLFMWGSW